MDEFDIEPRFEQEEGDGDTEGRKTPDDLDPCISNPPMCGMTDQGCRTREPEPCHPKTEHGVCTSANRPCPR